MTLEILALGGSAFLIGLTGAMSPGPLLTVTVAETIRRGRRSALTLMVGHAALEAVLMVGFAFGLQYVLRQPTVVTVVGLIGGVVLVWMGGSLLWGAVRGTLALDLEGEEPASKLGPVLRGITVSLSNPYWTLWWATIGVTLALKGLELGPWGVVAFFVGHELADITWYGIVILAVSAGRHLLSGRVYRVVMGVLASALVALGVSFLAASLRGPIAL